MAGGRSAREAGWDDRTTGFAYAARMTRFTLTALQLVVGFAATASECETCGAEPELCFPAS